MKDKKVDANLKGDIINFLTSNEDTAQDVVKTITNRLESLGEITGYSVIRDTHLTISTENDKYSIPLYNQNLKITPKIEKKRNELIKALDSYCENKGIPRINREAHMGNGKKPGFEHGSTKHHLSKPEKSLEFVQSYPLGYINGNVSSEKAKDNLVSKLQGELLVDYLVFDTYNNKLILDFKQGLNHLKHLVEKYRNEKGIDDLEFKHIDTETLREENKSLNTNKIILNDKLKQSERKIRDLEYELKKNEYSNNNNNTNKTYKFNSTNETLVDNVNWNQKRLYMLLKKVWDTGNTIIQSSTEDVFKNVSKEVIKFNINEEKVLDYLKAKDKLEKRSKIPDEKEYLSLMPDEDIKISILSSWKTAEKIIDEYENNLYTFPVHIKKQENETKYIFPIRNDIECTLKDYLIESLQDLTEKYDYKITIGKTSKEYITLSIPDNIETETVDSRLFDICVHAGINLKKMEYNTINASIEEIIESYTFDKNKEFKECKEDKEDIEEELTDIFQQKNYTDETYVQGLTQYLKGISKENAKEIFESFKSNGEYYRKLDIVRDKYDLILNELNPEANNLLDAIENHPRFNPRTTNAAKMVAGLINTSLKKLEYNINLVKEHGKKLNQIPLSYLALSEKKLKYYLTPK